MPDVPTAKEAAGTEFLIGVIRAIAAPPGVPADRAKVLERLLVNAMADVDYKNFIKKSGQPLVAGQCRGDQGTRGPRPRHRGEVQQGHGQGHGALVVCPDKLDIRSLSE